MKLRTPVMMKGLLASTGLLMASAAIAVPMSNDIQKYEFRNNKHLFHSSISADASAPKNGASAVISIANIGDFNKTDIANALTAFFNGISVQWTSLTKALPSQSASPLGINNVAQAPTSVPEPMTLALFGLGLAGIGLATRARRKTGSL